MEAKKRGNVKYKRVIVTPKFLLNIYLCGTVCFGDACPNLKPLFLAFRLIKNVSTRLIEPHLDGSPTTTRHLQRKQHVQVTLAERQTVSISHTKRIDAV